MTFSSPSLGGTGSITGTGPITGLGVSPFILTGSTAGTYGGIGFSGFTAADAANVSGAAGFDDGSKSSEGMTFAAATNVTLERVILFLSSFLSLRISSNDAG